MTKTPVRRKWPRGTWMRLVSGEALRFWMGEKDKSLADLAAAAEVSRGFISHLRAGRKTTCTPRVAVAIVRCLDVPMQVLFVPSISSDKGRIVKQEGRAA